MKLLPITILALSLINPALADNKSEAESCFRKSLALMESERHDLNEAIKLLDAAVELDSPRAELWAKRGELYSMKIDGEDEAIKSLDKAIELNPNCAEYWEIRGWCYAEKDEYIEAINDYTMAIKLEPNNAGYYLSRYYNHVDAGHSATPAKAVSDLMMAFKLGDTFAEEILRKKLLEHFQNFPWRCI